MLDPHAQQMAALDPRTPREPEPLRLMSPHERARRAQVQRVAVRLQRMAMSAETSELTAVCREVERLVRSVEMAAS